MATTKSVYPDTAQIVSNAKAGTFIPEIWSDEVIAAYKSNLVLANQVKKLGMTGKKGDVVHIPKPERGTATAKTSGNAVSMQAATESEVQVTIDKHFEYSRMIEDITETQALASLRQFYTGDAGYALAKQVDSDLFELGKSLGANGAGANWTTAGNNVFFNDSVNGLTQYADDTIQAADVFDDQAFRDMVQNLDDADVPMDGRCWVIPPVLRNTILGIEEFTSVDYVDNKGKVNGKIGNLYGVDILVSTNCPILEAANAANSNKSVRGSMLFHKDSLVLAEQQGIRSQTQYKQEFLGTLYTADTLYGTQVLRPESALVLAVSS